MRLSSSWRPVVGDQRSDLSRWVVYLIVVGRRKIRQQRQVFYFNSQSPHEETAPRFLPRQLTRIVDWVVDSEWPARGMLTAA